MKSRNLSQADRFTIVMGHILLAWFGPPFSCQLREILQVDTGGSDHLVPLYNTHRYDGFLLITHTLHAPIKAPEFLADRCNRTDEDNANKLIHTLRHSASPHGQEFDAQVNLAGFDQARHGTEIAARVLDPAFAAGDIVIVELQHIDDCDGGPDQTDLGHGFVPGTLIRAQRGPQVAPGRHDVGHILNRLWVVTERGAGIEDQFR
jgi:hypothetical protein